MICSGNDEENNPPKLEGSKHLATVVIAADGVLAVTLQIGGIVYTGVLLDASSYSSGIPTFVKLAKQGDSSEDASSSVTVEPTDCDSRPANSLCQFRHSCPPETSSDPKPIVLPSRSASLAASLLRHQERRQLRQRKNSHKARLFVCSMCKTHCLDTDDSDKEASNLITPPIKISFKSPDGPSVMEIEPREYKKSHHKRKRSSKHKSKKHSKKLKSADDDDALTADNSQGNGTCDETVELSFHDTSRVANQNCSEESEGPGLVMDIPGEKPPQARNGTDNSSDSQLVLSNQTETQSSKSRARKKPKTPKKAKAVVTDEEVNIVSKKTTRFVNIYERADGKRVSRGDVIWGKIVGFPWWPGRVCAISVSENSDGVMMGHTADIDWYCSPTKSHLPCCDVYPFLEDFDKRFDKKKKTKNYTRAVNEAKQDAVLNEQYLQSLSTTGNEETTQDESPPPASPSVADQEAACAATVPEQRPADGADTDRLSEPMHPADVPGSDSPTLLIDAFLRTNEQSANAFTTHLNKEYSNAAGNHNATGGNSDSEIEGCLTISLPSPRSLLSDD